ncbi:MULTISPECIES: alpha/beta fold hydrolase [Roseobacteraceae]|uniref:alpha/beta fold hydrolase n=1 Tax=Roseobacteraceae TaxID=2854170 RepID=UPI001C4808F0|nr:MULTISPECIES: alpha/beta hydrolase [Roseobacteraceae]MBV7408906.1 alpha/beta hydrolase [Maritimibacter sp. DP1N21-5]MBY5934407.1 alpha/beta hydrolase [Tateyamaria omphalii]
MQVTTRALGGHEFTVRSWGDPSLPMILMLHGFPEYGGAWDEVATRLSDQFYCIAPDQRGYGASYAPGDVGAYATSKLVGDMAALIGDQGPVIVMGHDWGASVAYGLAMFCPELVSHLIIANGVHPVPFQRAMAAGGAQSEASQYINFLRSPGSEDALAADDFDKLLQLFSAKMDMSWLHGDRLDAYKAVWRESGLKGMIHWYRASPLMVADPGAPVDMPDLPLDRLKVRCPHLLIWAEGDTALLPVSTEGLEEFAPDLTRAHVDGADHWLLHQKPDEVARIVREWLG